MAKNPRTINSSRVSDIYVHIYIYIVCGLCRIPEANADDPALFRQYFDLISSLSTCNNRPVCKPTPVRRGAVRETGVHRHHGGINWGPPWNSSYHNRTFILRDLRAALNWARISPRDVSLSDSLCIFFLVWTTDWHFCQIDPLTLYLRLDWGTNEGPFIKPFSTIML